MRDELEQSEYSPNPQPSSLSLHPSQIYCQIRKLWVAALPEELVRQNLITYMIQDLGYPSHSLVLEQGLRGLPHLSLSNQQKIPVRRADIICFAKDIHPDYALYPLLLIECKAVKLTAKVINQVAGYNHYLKARYIAIANQTEIQTGWYDPSEKKYLFVNHLPSYSELLQKL